MLNTLKKGGGCAGTRVLPTTLMLNLFEFCKNKKFINNHYWKAKLCAC